MSLKAKIDAKELSFLKSKLEKLKKPVEKSDAEDIGKVVIDEMKNMISKGISPILDQGRFPAYKNPERYPGKLKNKRPVNLKLSGSFLDSLKYKAVTSKSGYATEIFYKGKKQNLKEQGHRDGANGQPSRPTIPQDGEQFAARIKRLYSKIYKDRINRILKK